jgi:hypothetical protein
MLKKLWEKYLEIAVAWVMPEHTMYLSFDEQLRKNAEDHAKERDEFKKWSIKRRKRAEFRSNVISGIKAVIVVCPISLGAVFLLEKGIEGWLKLGLLFWNW